MSNSKSDRVVLFDELRVVVDRLYHKVQAMLPSPEQISAGLDLLVQSAEQLGQAGWVMAGEITLGEAHSLAAAVQAGPSGADDWFVRFYQPSTEFFRSLTDRLATNGELAEWQGLISECVWAYEQGKVRLVIPCMLPVLERLVVEFTRSTTSRKATDASKTWDAKAPKPAAGGMESVFYVSIAAFLKAVWEYRDFGQTPPDVINRNWLLHGRAVHNGNPADALRLLIGVAGVADYCARARP
jgi:hypothetical protein